MRRRDVVSLLGGAAVSWPRAGWAQQALRPVVGFLNPGSRADFEHHAEAFLKGLKESGFTEGETITVEYRWAEGRYERLPSTCRRAGEAQSGSYCRRLTACDHRG
jgi:putative ABC transport system substrate-binding protein